MRRRDMDNDTFFFCVFSCRLGALQTAGWRRWVFVKRIQGYLDFVRGLQMNDVDIR